MLNFKTIRESLTPEDIKRILSNYDVYPVYENANEIHFPTCCHGGTSPKLYYYKNTYMFHCYTECGTNFDIIELIKKIEELKGNECSLIEAAAKIGFEDEAEEISNAVQQDKAYNELMTRYEDYTAEQNVEIKILDNKVLNKFIFNLDLLQAWIHEGININTLLKFNIKYDVTSAAIVIPHRDINGNLIGVRGRFMSEDAPAKYMPLTYKGEYLAHPLGKNLYGAFENKKALQHFKTAIIFESEKSVLKMESIYGSERNFSVATCGNKISNDQIELLRKMGIENVVLAYDKDFLDGDYQKVKTRYDSIAKKLSNYFMTSVMMDFGSLLGYKDSPIDQGQEAFEELFKYKYFV